MRKSIFSRRKGIIIGHGFAVCCLRASTTHQRAEFDSYRRKKTREEGDGRTWTIKVGNKPIKTGEIFMVGGGSVVGSVPRGLPAISVPDINPSILFQLMSLRRHYFTDRVHGGYLRRQGHGGQNRSAAGSKPGTGGAGTCQYIGIFQQKLSLLRFIFPFGGQSSGRGVDGISSVFTSIAVVVVLLFFTPLLYHLPNAVLAAVIMMAVIGLVNIHGFIHAWQAQWYDGAISIISFLATLAFAPHLHYGIMIGIVLSLVIFLYKSMRPTVVSLSRHEDQAFKSSFFHQLEECRYVDLVRFDGPLFFANASYLEDKINDRLIQKKDLKDIVIVANGISDMDASGEEVLSLLIDRVRSAGVEISFSGVNEVVMAALKRTHLLEKIGQEHIYPTMERAVCEVQEHAHRGGPKKTAR